MPSDEEKTADHERSNGERLRRGQRVVRTTVEIESDLYKRIKTEVARKNTSLRNFISRAAESELTRPDDRPSGTNTDLKLLMDDIMKNPLTKKVLEIIEKEIPKPYGLMVLISRFYQHEITPEHIDGFILTDDFIEDLCRPIEFLSGKTAAECTKMALVELRGD